MHPNILKRHASVINVLVRIADILITIIAAYFAFLYKFSLNVAIPQPYLIAILLGAVATLMSSSFLGLYSPVRGRKIWRYLQRLVLSWIFIALILVALAFFTKTGMRFSREWFIAWMVIGFICSVCLRVVTLSILKALRRSGYNTRNIVIIGSGELGQSVYRRLAKGRNTGFRVVCFLDRGSRLQQQAIDHCSIRPIPEDLDQFLINESIDEVWLALPLRSLALMKQLLHQLRFSTTNIKVIPDIFELDLLNHSVIDVAGLPVISLRATPMEGLNVLIKAVEDKILSGLILLLISPLLFLIAIAVKLSSPGPIFYRQERVSWNNKTFMMLKFRSMPVNVESKTGAVWAKSGENRATRVGAFLRKTSLDELPQFINVLKGDMSIVGPRPERPVFVEQFKNEIPGYMQKHLVKAGITGWAQVNGWRGSTDLKKRIEYDLYYIEHWSLKFDLKIILLTIFKGFINKNAY